MLYSRTHGSFKQENRCTKVFKGLMFYYVTVKSLSVTAADVLWHATVDKFLGALLMWNI